VEEEEARRTFELLEQMGALEEEGLDQEDPSREGP
jgi:hydrogenase maturation factor